MDASLLPKSQADLSKSSTHVRRSETTPSRKAAEELPLSASSRCERPSAALSPHRPPSASAKARLRPAARGAVRNAALETKRRAAFKPPRFVELQSAAAQPTPFWFFYPHDFILNNPVLSPGLPVKEAAPTTHQESEASDVSGQIPPNVNWWNTQIYACLHGTRNGKAVTQTAAQAPDSSDDKHCFFKAERRFWGRQINQNGASL